VCNLIMFSFKETNMYTQKSIHSGPDQATEGSLKLDKQCGITLVELIVVVAIIGILVSITTAGLWSMTGTTRLTQAVNDLRGNMERAKMAAVQENMPSLVVFNSTSPGGYQACIDANENDDCDTGEETILRQDFADYQEVSLQSVNFSGSNKVVFNSRGLPESVSGGFAAGTVNCTDTQGNSRKVVMTSSGGLRID